MTSYEDILAQLDDPEENDELEVQLDAESEDEEVEEI